QEADAGSSDAGQEADAGGSDAGQEADAGSSDAGSADSGTGDAGAEADAGPVVPPTGHFWTFDDGEWVTQRRDTAEIARVYTTRQSWVVVYADDNGAPGAELLHERVSQLSQNRILLRLDPQNNTGAHWQPNQLLHLAVYGDDGVRGAWDPATDALLLDRDGQPMARALNLRFISSTTVESSEYYHRNCTTEQFENNRTDLPVDCRCNEALTGGLPICWAPGESFADGHGWGSGPRPAQVNSVGREVGGGFLDEANRELVVAMNWKDDNYTQSVGVIWAINIDTGARRVVSGTLDTPTGYQTHGAGYESNVTVGGVLRHTATLPYLWDVQPGPDGAWYTYASDTQDNVEIVRIDPLTGDRALVWHIDVAGQGHTMGQCTTSRVNALSVQYTERSFAMDPLTGDFYLSFHDSAVGDGIVRIPLDGSTCTPVMRINGTVEAQAQYPTIGGGASIQSQNIRGMGWVNNTLYIYTPLGKNLYAVDPLTGYRTLVSSVEDQVGTGHTAIGENWFLWDDNTQLLWTSGGAADNFVAVDLATGNRQNLLQLSSLSPLVPGGYPVEHAPRGPLNPGTWSRQRFAWHPDNRDHIMMMVNSIALTIYELHTSNSYNFSM
ncbi:MAG: hypothetical protein AB2A00_28180, partial [Myxococcota bacterium]